MCLISYNQTTEDISIFEQNLSEANSVKLAMFNNNNPMEPIKLMDKAIDRYTNDNDLFNQFIEMSCTSWQWRVVINNITSLPFEKVPDENVNDLQVFKCSLADGKGEVVILMGGLTSDTPIGSMDKIAERYSSIDRGNLSYQFITIEMDNPWVRVVITGIDKLPFTSFKVQRMNQQSDKYKAYELLKQSDKVQFVTTPTFQLCKDTNKAYGLLGTEIPESVKNLQTKTMESFATDNFVEKTQQIINDNDIIVVLSDSSEYDSIDRIFSESSNLNSIRMYVTKKAA